ncbi:hypothetical protein ACHQM5_001051 [Ranunculus cassubicifolius]
MQLRLRLRKFSTISSGSILGKNWNPLPIPHGTIPKPLGQDLDFINVAHSHLVHTDWPKLNALATALTPFRVKHILLLIQKDPVLSFEFFNWAERFKPNSHSLDTVSIILHVLTKANRFKSAEVILRSVLTGRSLDSCLDIFDAILYTYRICDSSPRVFDCLFKTCAHLRKFRNATDVFCRMKEYGFLPKVESCNAYLSSLIGLKRADIALRFYREMLRCRISPNVYTYNMVICALCQSGKLEKAVEVFKEMENRGCSPTIESYNTLIAGHCNQGLISSAMKLKSSMAKNGIQPNVVTYNTLIHGFCKEGKLNEANRVFSEMKVMDTPPNTITYNTLINGYSQVGNSDMGYRIYEEMLTHAVKTDILTYNALILGLCKEGKTKKAASLVKELDKDNLVPNASTFANLITGQCVRQNSERAFQLFRAMKKSGCHPNAYTFNILISTFCKNEDFEGAVQVLNEMLDRLLKPESDLLVELCEGLGRCKNYKLVYKVCMDIEKRGLLPEGFEKQKFIMVEGEVPD